jgi:hypothetical protein
VAVLSSLADRGIRLTPRDGKLVARLASKLTDDDRQAVRQCRADLLDLLETAAIVNARPFRVLASSASSPPNRGLPYTPIPCGNGPSA